MNDTEAVQKEASLSTRHYSHLALLFAQVAAQADADRHEPLRAQYAALCRRRAVQRLQQLLESLPEEQRESFWRERIDEDPFLTPIRRSPGYAELARRYNLPVP